MSFNRGILVIVLIIFIAGCDSTEPTKVEDENYFDATYLKYNEWYQSSIPVKLKDSLNLSNDEFLKLKANVYWINPLPPDVRLINIIETDVERDLPIPSISISYEPGDRACYNNNQNYIAGDSSWGSVVTNIKNEDKVKFGTNLENVTLSMWVRILQSSNLNSFTMDIGEISEDIIPNNRADYEDLNQNGKFELGESYNEDRGLDQLADSQEPEYEPINNTDPNHDNYLFGANRWNYETINFHEGNGIMDTEDINGNLVLDTLNNYYSYEISLDTLSNQYLALRYPERDWMQLKIPLNSYFEKTGNPSVNDLNQIRFWFVGNGTGLNVSIAEIKFIAE